MLQILLSPLAILLSLSTSTSVLIHETKIDKLAILSVSASALAAQGFISLHGMAHTHIEPGMLDSPSHEFRTQNPGMTPRRDRDEKYRLGKKVPRGYFLFDSYFLPLDQI